MHVLKLPCSYSHVCIHAFFFLVWSLPAGASNFYPNHRPVQGHHGLRRACLQGAGTRRLLARQHRQHHPLFPHPGVSIRRQISFAITLQPCKPCKYLLLSPPRERERERESFIRNNLHSAFWRGNTANIIRYFPTQLLLRKKTCSLYREHFLTWQISSAITLQTLQTPLPCKPCKHRLLSPPSCVSTRTRARAHARTHTLSHTSELNPNLNPNLNPT